MSKVINGVPEHISRADYLHLIESVGFDVYQLKSLRFGHDGIYAEVIEKNLDGQPRIETQTNSYAVNTVYIPVKDEEAS